MDATRFDRLVKSLVTAGTRRSLMQLVAGLPLLGGLATLWGEEDADAKGRRKRRKKRHKHGKGNGRKRKGKKKQCKAKSKATTCAGKCGIVKNNCKKNVDCGSCACEPSCDVCFTCQEGPTTPGVCVPDPNQQGDACGEPGQICQAEGICACDETSCDPPATCGGGNPGTPGVCGCTPSTCPAGANCGTIANVCGGEVSCGGPCENPTPACVDNVCTVCADNEPCGDDEFCCDGSCVTGVCCGAAACAPIGDECVGNQCTCGGDPACAGGPELCCDAACVDTDTDPDHCGACDQPCSGDTPVCWNGACVCGDVCANGCQFTSIQAAIESLPDESTIRICAGVYLEHSIPVNKDLTLIGAGDGSNPLSNTILDAGGAGRVADVGSGVTATFEGLRFTGGIFSGTGGAGIRNGGTLTMTGCTVTGNEHTLSNGVGGGIYNRSGATLTMTDCHIVENDSVFHAGGIGNAGTLTMTTCVVEKNTAGDSGGGVYGNGGTVTLTGCTIGPDNAASYQGGGIVAYNGTPVTLADTDVTGNSAGIRGGGIFDQDGSVELTDGSTVSGNSAPTDPNCSGAVSGPGCA